MDQFRYINAITAHPRGQVLNQSLKETLSHGRGDDFRHFQYTTLLFDFGM